MYEARPRLSYRSAAPSHMRAHLTLTNREAMLNLNECFVCGDLVLFVSKQRQNNNERTRPHTYTHTHTHTKHNTDINNFLKKQFCVASR